MGSAALHPSYRAASFEAVNMKIFSGLSQKELLALTLSVLISSIFTARSFYATYLAWLETPNIFNFWQFVFPNSHKFESKLMYFGIHIFFAVVVLLGTTTSFLLQKTESRDIKILVSQVCFIIYLYWLQSITIARAIQIPV